MAKSKVYVPFRFRLSPIKKMAMIHFHKDPDEEYVALEFQYIKGEGYGEGFRVLAWRRDGYRDSYLDKHVYLPEDEEVLSIGGKGLKERHRVSFDEAYFEHTEGQLDAGFVFNDKMNRRIVLYVDEKIKKDSQTLTWLPSVGNHTEEPHSMPLFFLYDFDFARKRDTDVFLSIDGVSKNVDPFAFPKNFQARFYVEFSTNSVVTNFNEAGNYKMAEVAVDETGTAVDQDKEYYYEKYNDLYHLKKMVLKHDRYPVDIDFSPSFPNHEELQEGIPKFGEFTIRPSGNIGTLTGKYTVIKQNKQATITLTFSESWQTPKGTLSEQVMSSITPNIKSWYKTYHCVQVVHLESFETNVKWNRVDSNRRTTY